MNDDAMAPVIAVMLILAIGVTVFAVYTSTYLPGLKQQAEIEHMKEVESGFTKFSSDIDQAFTFVKLYGRNSSLVLSEQIPLGGGDIMLNSVKSRGNIRIQESELGNLTINDSKIFISGPGYHPDGTVFPLTTVNFSYEPVHNFWVNKSYSWERGIVNVTQWPRSTPLNYYTMDDPDMIKRVASYQLSDSLNNFVFPRDNTLMLTEMNTSSKKQVSGNGMGTLEVTTTDATDAILTGISNPISNATIYFVNPDGTVKTIVSDRDINLEIVNITIEAV